MIRKPKTSFNRGKVTSSHAMDALLTTAAVVVSPSSYTWKNPTELDKKLYP
jgi:hypothetical protein